MINDKQLTSSTLFSNNCNARSNLINWEFRIWWLCKGKTWKELLFEWEESLAVQNTVVKMAKGMKGHVSGKFLWSIVLVLPASSHNQINNKILSIVPHSTPDSSALDKWALASSQLSKIGNY